MTMNNFHFKNDKTKPARQERLARPERTQLAHRRIRIFDASFKEGIVVPVRHNNRQNSYLLSFQSRNHLTWGGAVVLLISTLILVAFGGCSQSKPSEDQQRHRPESKVEKGPVEMIVRADRSEARIAEPISVAVEVRALKGVDVKFPQAEKKLGPFEIMNVDDAPDVPIDGGKGRLWTRKFALESLKSGKLKIPAVTVDFTDNRNPAKPIHSQLTSQELELQIASVLEAKPDPTKFRDIKGTVEIPAEKNYTWISTMIGSLIGTALISALAMLAIRMKRNRILTADQWALSQLARLQDDGLVEAGQIEGFYVRLTNIIRAYIERRFTIHAPNRTTREFLEEAHAHPRLEEYRGELRENLQSADMVKFAKFRPAQNECQDTMETAKNFVVTSAGKQKTHNWDIGLCFKKVKI